MGSTLVRPLCALGICSVVQPPASRVMQNVPDYTTVVAGSPFQLQLTYEGILDPTTLSVTRQRDEMVFTCSASSPVIRSCMLNFTAGIAGTSDIFEASNQYAYQYVDPVPSQPSMNWFTNGMNDTQASYQLRTSEFSTIYGQGNLSACLLTWSPSSVVYDADDLPSTWPRNDSSFNFTSSNADVSSRVWLNPAENSTMTGPWSDLTTSAGVNDYYFVCYNDVGHSPVRAIRHFQAVKRNETAPIIHSVVTTFSDSVDYLQSTIDFEVMPYFGAIGHYYDDQLICKICPVGQESCQREDIYAYGSNSTLIMEYWYDRGNTPSIEIYVQCSIYQPVVHMSMISTAYVYPPVDKPKPACELGRCIADAYLNGNQVESSIVVNSTFTLQSQGGEPGQLVQFAIFVPSLTNVFVDMGNCTSNKNHTEFQSCNSTTITLDPDMFSVGSWVQMCNKVLIEPSPRCVNYRVVAPVPSPSHLEFEYTHRPEVSENRWNVTATGSLSHFSYLGAAVDGCCFFYGPSPSSVPMFDNYTEANSSQTNHLCTDSPILGTSFYTNPNHIVPAEFAGVTLDMHHICFNRYGASFPASILGRLWVEAVPLGPTASAEVRGAKVRVWITPGEFREYISVEDTYGYFAECSVQVMPAGIVMNTTRYVQQSIRSSDSFRVDISHDWQIYPSIDVYSQCVNHVGAGAVSKITYSLPMYITVQCADPTLCPLVLVEGTNVQTVVQGTVMNITGHRSTDDADNELMFTLYGETIGACLPVNGACSINYTMSNNQSSLTLLRVSDVSLDLSGEWLFVPVAPAPSQPLVDVTFDMPSGLNSTITLTSSLYAREYAADGSANMTDCMLAWGTPNDMEQVIGTYRGMNSSFSYSFVPTHQGQQLTLYFRDLLPANMTGTPLMFQFQCFNSYGSSVPMAISPLTAIARLPSPVSDVVVNIDDWDIIHLEWVTPQNYDVGYEDVNQESSSVSIQMFIGYAGFNLSRGEYNYSVVLDGLSMGYINYYISRDTVEKLDLSLSSDWDFYFAVVNQVGQSEFVNVSVHFDNDLEEGGVESIVLSFTGSDYWDSYLERDFCRACAVYVDPESDPKAYYPIWQSDEPLWFRVRGWTHQHVSVVVMVNSTHNITVDDRWINPQNNYYFDMSRVYNLSNSSIGTNYNVVALSSGSNVNNASQTSTVHIRVVARVPRQVTLVYMGPNNAASLDDEDTEPGLMITNNEVDSTRDILGCMLVWGPSSSLYEADDLPMFFNRSFIDDRAINGTGLYLDAEEVLQRDNSDRSMHLMSVQPIDDGVLISLDELSSSTDAQDYHFVCYNEYGHSAKASAYNVITTSSAPGVMHNFTAVPSVDLTSLNVSITLPSYTGDIGVLGFGTTVEFASCTVEWYVSSALTGSHMYTSDNATMYVGSQLEFVVSDLDLFVTPSIMFSTYCARYDNMTHAGMQRNFTYVWHNPYNYSHALVVDVAPRSAVSQVTQWSNFSNDASTQVMTIVQGTVVNFTVSYYGRSQLSLVDLNSNSTVVDTCNTGMSGVCRFGDVVMPTVGVTARYRVMYNTTVHVDPTYLSVVAGPSQPLITTDGVSLHLVSSSTPVVGCVLSAGTAASSYVVQPAVNYSAAVNQTSTVYVMNAGNTTQSSNVTQQQLFAAGLSSGVSYHMYWTCYDEAAASAPAALFSFRVTYVPAVSSSSSSSTGSASSSTAQYVATSSTSDLSSSSAEPATTLSSSSTIIVGNSSSSSAVVDVDSSSSSVVTPTNVTSSSSGTVTSSTGASNGVSSSSSTAAVVSSSTSTVSSSSSSAVVPTPSSSSSAVVPAPSVPVGTVQVSFRVTFPSGEITITFVTALTNDILATISQMLGLPIELLRPFVTVSIGTSVAASSNRRLLDQSLPVSFTLLGNITTVTGNVTLEPGMSVNATSIATSVAGAITNGTMVTTSSASLGLVVPQQPTQVVQVVPPVIAESSSSTGGVEGTEEDDSSSSSLSSGGIAGAVVGSVVGFVLLVALAVAIYSGALSSLFGGSTPAVAQANANEIKPKQKPVEPSVEMEQV